MSLAVALTHRTTYRYSRPVALGPQTIRLRPAPHTRTTIISYALRIEPAAHFLNWQQDPQGNHLARVVFPERVGHFTVTVDLLADMTTINPFDFFLEPQAESFPFAYDPALAEELAPFRHTGAPGPRLDAFLATLPDAIGGTTDTLVAINRAVQARIGYIVRMEPGVMTPDETLAAGQGSCRDSAWLLVVVLRRLGFAARFVSGYLIQLVADVAPREGPAGPAADFTDLHAWTEVYLPGAGWIGFDPTSGLLAGEGHIPLAASPEPQSAAPISGLMEPAETSFGFEMSVKRVAETPRVTKPYAEPGWAAIVAAGKRVDRALEAADLRLTMGGEPTFVAASDVDAPEWNTEALGPTKRGYGERLMRALAPEWAPGAALQAVSGKHYPGEQLPRWALHAHWRKDGVPVWQDPALLATEADTDNADADAAARFCAALARRLDVDPALIMSAHEDVHYYLWRERRLPANVLAEDARLADPLERARLARVFAGAPGAPVGSVLPLRRAVAGGTRRWQSGRWHFRTGALFLTPGDSPIGLRLPLDSLPWADPDSIAPELSPDPFAPRPKLPDPRAFRDRAAAAGAAPFPPVAQPEPETGPEGADVVRSAGAADVVRSADAGDVVRSADAGDVVRTALVVEPRGGLIHVFFPPLAQAEDWLALAAAVEATAAQAGRKVVLEGYPPPRDPRLEHFSITPDPGVIEVNMHPAASWPDLIGRGEQLYAAARAVGLAAEKFMLDGRHTGTGGGNHVTMGAAEAADSPFLRRPDLLKSLIGFWHNHPSLSYLFSGLFIGPSSQHPRIDEARHDSLAELEIAFATIAPGRETPPWLIDRLLRHLLADMTGNTHRTEFCIDKLYAPESASGRLGLVEFRAFEMPPHARMAAAQQLLPRAALAAFAASPYDRDLIRWGSRIHDDFMLPYHVARDFHDALAELKARGFALDPDWFAPHLEFRFPPIGMVTLAGMELELRHALEPWHVLGEEPAGGGTARYVDSSVERVQVLIRGHVPERFVLGCNGHAVPLTPTDRAGAFVGGVRFKAWQPPWGLHPTIPAQSPLVFDLFDRWNGRSLGGMTHHVAHPGGRHYERFPVNANEAEARRRGRFFPFGHTPGPMAEPQPAASRETPRTLDLRRG